MESHKIIQVEEKVPLKLLLPLSIQHMFAMLGHRCWFRSYSESIQQSYFL